MLYRNHKIVFVLMAQAGVTLRNAFILPSVRARSSSWFSFFGVSLIGLLSSKKLKKEKKKRSLHQLWLLESYFCDVWKP